MGSKISATVSDSVSIGEIARDSSVLTYRLPKKFIDLSFRKQMIVTSLSLAVFFTNS